MSILKYSGSVPENYDREYGPVLFTPYAKHFVQTLSAMEHLPPSPRVLELACGTGRLTAELVAHFSPGVRILATDLSEPMLGVARSRVEGNVEWRQADMQALPLEDDSFDLVVAQFGLMLVPDRSRAVAEASRVLARGGSLVFSVWSLNSALQYIGVNTVLPFLEGVSAEGLESMRAAPFSMADTEKTVQLLQSHGFSDVSYETHSVTIDDVDAWSRGFVCGTGIGGNIPEHRREDAIAALKTAYSSQRPAYSEALIYKARKGR